LVNLNRIALFCLVVAFLALPTLAFAQQPPNGMSLECENGASFDNGVKVTINQMRSGFTYTATAIGLNGFDPVLAVVSDDGSGLCSDDDSDAADYELILPTTGEVAASGTSSQVIFDQNSSEAFADVSLVVGGYSSQLGEFVLILEGMAVTEADNAGDSFTVQITPGMIASDTALTVYMIGRDSGLDPFMYLIDNDLSIIEDGDGNQITCDDAGSSLCWSEADNLEDSGVATNTGVVRGESVDSLLSFNLNNFELDEDPNFNTVTFLMSSYSAQTYGQYVLMFHMGLAEPDEDTGGSSGGIGNFQGGGGK